MTTDQTTTPKSLTELANDALTSMLVPYLSPVQRKTLISMLNGEEGAFFAERVLNLLDVIETMPKTYEQSELGEQAVVHLHYFTGPIDAWVTERDITDGVSQAFGLQCIDGVRENAELGYISITELVTAGAEVDLHWTPKTVAEIQGGK